MTDRVVTFSIKPDDKSGRDSVDKLKQEARETGISFSYLVLEAIRGREEAKG